MKFLNEDLSKQLIDIFGQMSKSVNLALFTKEGECYTCEETRNLLSEVSMISDKIVLHEYDMVKDADKAQTYGVDKTPSLVILDENMDYRGIKFFGIPAGHEINSFISSILEVSGSGEQLPDDISSRLEAITNPMNIKVFVTLSCPYCPGAVSKAHKLALENTNITSEMIEAQTFNEMSNEYDVSGVPKIVINDKYEFTGNQPIEVFLENLEKAQKEKLS
ncbi:MAG: thioredoxin family protein [Firmicutes bacterium]|nr:thioredoxin family protein [Bacillota bacterium]